MRDDDDLAKPRRGLRNLSVLDVSTGNVRRLVTHADPMRVGDVHTVAWSPDSTRLAYPWCDYGDAKRPVCELRVIAIVGQNSHLVLPRSQTITEPFDWSPDGRLLLALIRQQGTDAGNRLVLITVETGNVRELSVAELTSGDAFMYSNAHFSRDSRSVVFTKFRSQSEPYSARLGGDVLVVPIDDATERPLIDHPANDRFVAWTPDGRRLLFTSDRSGSDDLWIVDVADGVVVGEPAIIKRQVGLIDAAGMTSTGRLLYRSSEEWSTQVEVAGLDAATGRLTTTPEPVDRNLARRRGNPAWSATGESLAYRSAPAKPRPDFYTDGYDTITIHAAGGGPRSIRLDHPCLNDWHSWRLSWAPDNRSLLMAIDGSAAKCRGLYVVDAQTGVVKTMVQRNVYLTFGSWLPDGKSVTFVSQHRDLIIRDVETGVERTVLNLTTRPEYENGRIVGMVPSHIGRSAAVIVERADRQRRLAVLKLANGVSQDTTTLTEVSAIHGARGWGTVAWTLDDRFLLVVENPLAFERFHTEAPAMFVLENVLPRDAVTRRTDSGGSR